MHVVITRLMCSNDSFRTELCHYNVRFANHHVCISTHPGAEAFLGVIGVSVQKICNQNDRDALEPMRALQRVYENRVLGSRSARRSTSRGIVSFK